MCVVKEKRKYEGVFKKKESFFSKKRRKCVLGLESWSDRK